MTDLHDTISFITTEAAKIARQWLPQCIAYTSFVTTAEGYFWRL